MEANDCGIKESQLLLSNTTPLNHKNQTPEEHVNNLFTKRISLTSNESYSLPEPKRMFKETPWKIDILQSLKNKLNGTKNLLNDYNINEWQSHTRLTNSARDVMIRIRRDIQPEFMTQAWCKFYEIVSSFPLIPIDLIMNGNKSFKSIHLCEAPGAFVASLNHWLKTNVPDIHWDWIALTLNPYYEGNLLSIMIDDDRFIRHTLDHWCFGEDNTGNLMNLRNLDELVRLSEPKDEIFLVTADGSVDCMDVPHEQETIVAHLHFCETIAALHLLTTGGSFLLKIFTVFEHQSVCLLYLLSCCFEKVSITKPATSKEGNSESYVVCTNFKGQTFISSYLEEFRKYFESGSEKAMFCKNDISPTFINKIINCSEFFTSQQCQIIMKNIHTFKLDNNSDVYREMKKIQRMVADKYIRHYNVKRLICGEIVGKLVLTASTSINTCKKALQESYNERCKKQHLAPLDRLKKLFNDSENIQMYVLSDGFVQSVINKLPEDLPIHTGKMFDAVCSSRFCDTSILKIRNGVDSIIFDLKCKVQFPSLEDINKLRNKVSRKSKRTLLVFHYTDPYDSHSTITKIYETMQCLRDGETLVLVGYTLLTHFNVGLLYLISCAFKSITIKICNDVGSKLILRYYTHTPKISNHISDIMIASSNAHENGKAILEIIPASFLYESGLFFAMVDVNHWIIKSFVHYVQNMLQNSTINEESVI